jgi:hypothetical protein
MVPSRAAAQKQKPVRANACSNVARQAPGAGRARQPSSAALPSVHVQILRGVNDIKSATQQKTEVPRTSGGRAKLPVTASQAPIGATAKARPRKLGAVGEALGERVKENDGQRHWGEREAERIDKPCGATNNTAETRHAPIATGFATSL